MRVLTAAVGRLRGGPEAELCRDYLDRATATGRALGLGPFAGREIDAAGDRGKETAALLKLAPPGAVLVALDERGEAWTSRALAAKLAAWRDGGARDAVFLIGGADGHDPALAPPLRLAFGPQTWPHRLARVMLCEQLYRAASILAGAPYHRD